MSGWTGGHPRWHAARPAVTVAAVQSRSRPLGPSWQGPLALAASGQGTSPQEAARLRAACDAAYRRLTRFETGWPPARTDRQAWWDYAAARACTALRDEDWTAAARAVTDLYGLTGPAEAQATAWLRQLAATALPRVPG